VRPSRGCQRERCDGRPPRRLAEEGYRGLATADLQALLWFPENDLYANLGYRDKKSESTDYATEFANLARDQGKDAGLIRQAMKRDKRTRGGR
jgi:hypothetical protein